MNRRQYVHQIWQFGLSAGRLSRLSDMLIQMDALPAVASWRGKVNVW